MHHYTYSPFNKDIKEVEAADLIVLKDVHEGWYIDYKEKQISVKNIAKHISAFANQFGGWLFFGIKESEEKEKKTAGEYTGINKNEIQALSIAIREAVTVHSNPEIYYEEKIIYGPNETIQLIDDNAILIIYVPEGSYPPYVHSSGRIFRRIADQSYPQHETNRFVLDQLWNKGKKNFDRIEKTLFKFPDYGANYPVVYIHLFTNIFLEKNPEELSFADFKEIMGPKPIDGGSVPMDAFYSVRGGLFSRQTRGNTPFNQVTSLRWWHDGNALLTIPISICDLPFLTDNPHRFEYSDELLFEIRNQNFDEILICDFQKLIFGISCLFNQFTHLLERTNNKEKIFAAIRIEKTFRITPFIDDVKFIEQIRENGIPLIEDSSIKIPEIFSPYGLIDLNKEIKLDDPTVATNKGIMMIFQTLPIIGAIFFSLGILNEPSDILKFESIYDPEKINRQQT